MVNVNIPYVKFLYLADAKIVRQIHVAIVEQALGDSQVLAFVTVEHGHLAVVKRVEAIDRETGEEKKYSQGTGRHAPLPQMLWGTIRGEMEEERKKQAQCPEGMGRPKDGQVGKIVGNGMPKGYQAYQQENKGE